MGALKNNQNKLSTMSFLSFNIAVLKKIIELEKSKHILLKLQKKF